jgi:hypothetical protein
LAVSVLGLAQQLETLRAKKRGGQEQRYDRQPGEWKRRRAIACHRNCPLMTIPRLCSTES